MMSPTFSIVAPHTVEEALDLLAARDESVRPIGGGSGLALLIKYGLFEPRTLVHLRHLVPELAGVEATADGGLRLGALSTLRDLEEAPQISTRAPVLKDALQSVGSIRLRNVAQLGGAIGHGDPRMDLPPVLLAVDARVRVTSQRGERWIAAKDLFRGYYETAIEDDELILEVVLPPLGEHRGAYRKVTARTAEDWPMIAVVVIASRDSRGIKDLRAAVGAISDRPQRLSSLEDSISGPPPTSAEIEELATDAAARLEFDDAPSALADYLRQLVAVNLRRALETVVTGVRDQA